MENNKIGSTANLPFKIPNWDLTLQKIEMLTPML